MNVTSVTVHCEVTSTQTQQEVSFYDSATTTSHVKSNTVVLGEADLHQATYQ